MAKNISKEQTFCCQALLNFFPSFSKNLSCEGSYSGHEKRITGLHLCEDPEDKRSRLLFTSSRDQQLQCRVLRVSIT